jgi:hypothetical protein
MEQIRRTVGGDEYLSALASVRAAKNCFLVLIVLAILAQLAAFVAVRWVGVIDRTKAVTEMIQVKKAVHGPATATAPAGTQPATAAAPGQRFTPEAAELWYAAMAWALPATKFLALGCGLVLALTLLLAVNLALVGRTGGAGGFVSAFFWSLVAWVCLIPWQQILVATLTTGALYNLNDLVRATNQVTWASRNVTLQQEALYYMRFVAYPVLVLMVLLVVQAKFARGYKRMSLAVTQAEMAQMGAQPEKL